MRVFEINEKIAYLLKFRNIQLSHVLELCVKKYKKTYIHISLYIQLVKTDIMLIYVLKYVLIEVTVSTGYKSQDN